MINLRQRNKQTFEAFRRSFWGHRHSSCFAVVSQFLANNHFASKVLMEIFCLIESIGWFSAGVNLLTPFLQCFHKLFGDVLLRLVEIPNCRPVLARCCTGWIVQTSPFSQELSIRYLRWVELDLESFRMVVDGKIGWIVDRSTSIAHDAIDHTGYGSKVLFWVPKSSTCTHQYLIV